MSTQLVSTDSMNRNVSYFFCMIRMDLGYDGDLASLRAMPENSEAIMLFGRAIKAPCNSLLDRSNSCPPFRRGTLLKLAHRRATDVC
jgi:hypothetical protein